MIINVFSDAHNANASKRATIYKGSTTKMNAMYSYVYTLKDKCSVLRISIFIKHTTQSVIK